MRETWTYSNLIEEQRQDQLLSVNSFETVTEQIAKEMSVLCYHLQGCDSDSRYSRPVFCVRVSPELFDAFFNSPKGYRAAYFESPFHGLECNHYFLERLLPRLSEWAAKNFSGYSAEFSHDALLAVSAKAWLAEVSMELCPLCEGEWSPPTDEEAEIINERWNLSESPDSKFGRKAPQCTKIRLLGAFLSAHGDEFVPARKRDRHQQIHWQGWS